MILSTDAERSGMFEDFAGTVDRISVAIQSVIEERPKLSGLSSPCCSPKGTC